MVSFLGFVNPFCDGAQIKHSTQAHHPTYERIRTTAFTAV